MIHIAYIIPVNWRNQWVFIENKATGIEYDIIECEQESMGTNNDACSKPWRNIFKQMGWAHITA